MGEFGHNMPRSPGNKNSNGQCRKDHGNAQRLKDHTPANIFYQPEQDMQVLNFAEFGWYNIQVF
jgi:hypothetical protein